MSTNSRPTFTEATVLVADPDHEVLIRVIGWAGVLLFVSGAIYGVVEDGWWGAILLLMAIPYALGVRFNVVRELRLDDDRTLLVIRQRGSVRVALASITSIERRISEYPPRETVIVKLEKCVYPLLGVRKGHAEFTNRVLSLRPDIALIGW